MAKKKTINMVKSQVIYKDYSKDAERTALVSGENLSHMFGKIARWYTDISWVGHTHTEANITDFGTYAGASTKGGAATSANKLNIGSADIGSETKPVYFSYLTGKPVACTYSLNASVPANAVFTDINVKQSPSTADESREVLFAGNTGNTETTGTVGKSNKLYFNPSTGALTATSFSGSIAASNLTGTIDAGRLPTTAVTAGSYGPAAGGTLTYGGTFDVPYVTVDKYGRLTAGSTKTFTMPAQYTHPTYTSKTSAVYKITVDNLGHVSAATSATAADVGAMAKKGSCVNGANYNDFNTTGFFEALGNSDNPTQNAPNGNNTNNNFYVITQQRAASYFTQIATSVRSDKTMYIRSYTNSTWSDWVEMKFTDTVYVHPTYTEKANGLYKITVDRTGHVSGTAAVTAADLPAHTHDYLPTTTKYAISDSVGGVALSSYSNHLKFINEMNFSKLSATGHVWFGYRWDTDGTTESGSDIDLYVTRYKFGNASGSGQLAEVEASSFIGNASSANIPYGFSSRSTRASWVAGGTFVTAWNAGDSCEIAFVKNYPASSQLSCCIDGYFFQNEGKKRVLDEANYSSYVTPAGIGALPNTTKYALSETVGGPAIAATAIKLSHGNEINFSKLGNGYEDIFFGWRWREADGSESSDADAGLNCYHFLKGGGNSAYAAIKAAEFRGNATSATTATTATTASKLGTNAGSNVAPVYFSGGVPVACKQDASGAHFSTVPLVRSDGVMEIGRYIDFHSTDTTTEDYTYRFENISAGSMRLSANGSNDNIFTLYSAGYNQLRFHTTATNKAYNSPGITVRPLTSSGSLMQIECGGNMVIGSGESPSTLYSNSYDNLDTSETERLYLASDNEIYFITNAQTYAGVKRLIIDKSGNLKIQSDQHIIQLQNSTSNYTSAIKWWKSGTDPGNYGPEIGQHNTGDTDGSICILPYNTSTSPWGGTVGLFISKTRLLYNGTAISLNGHTHSYAGSSTAGGSANRAVQSDNCKVTVTDPSSLTTYGIVFVADPNTTEDNALRKSLSIRMNHFVGAANTEGITELIIGNAVAKSSAGNSSGHLTLYNSNGKWAEIYPDASATVDYKLYLPASTGTLALVGDNNHTHNYVPNTRAGMIAGINLLDAATAAPTDDSYYIAQENNASTTNYYRRKHSGLWSYIKGKADSVYAAASHNHDSSYVAKSMIDISTTANLGLDGGKNAFGYVSGLTKAAWNNNQTDGVIIRQFYNASWKTELFIDYRTGQTSVRGKNNGTFTDWGSFAILKSDGSYWGICSPSGANNVWIRTTTLGIIPYESGGLGSGHGGIGTSSWHFSYMYCDDYHGATLKLGSSSVQGLIEIQGPTSASVSYGSSNPRIRFKNSDGSQNIDIVMNDWDSVRAPAALSIHGNQGGEYLLAPNISAWDYTNNKLMAMLSSWSLGTTSVVGQGRVIAGNGTKKGTAGNARGLVEIYSEQDGAAFIIAPPSLTTDVTLTLPSTDGTLELVGHTHSYLPLSGGTLTGNLSLTETKSILLRPNHSNYTAGIGYDTSGNECIGIWAKNTVTRLRWHAGTDMTTMTYGTMMGITPDFEISKASGTAKGYIAGDSIVTYKILWSGSTSCTARSSTDITLTTSIAANKYRFIKIVWNVSGATGVSEIRADTLNAINNVSSASGATTTNIIQFTISSDGKKLTVGPGTTTITVLQIAGVCVI